MKYPSISICIPTYNEELTIELCLRSILSKKYPGILELLIVDGGSTDKTVQLAQKYPVKIIHNKHKNFNAEYGKQIGFFQATGEYFMLIDCDMTLIGEQWFEKLLKPLVVDQSIIGSWPAYKYTNSDPLINKFLTFHPLQLDPIFEYFVSPIKACVISKKSSYWLLEYDAHHVLPSGFCLFRRKQLLATAVGRQIKFMENDNVLLLLKEGFSRYAFVQSIGFHHKTANSIWELLGKRIRNLNQVYFEQPVPRLWTWIDWTNKRHILKVLLWIFYTYLIFPSIFVGIYKSIKYKTIAGMYELPVNVLTTTVIIYVFLTHKEGKKLLRMAMT